MLARGGLCSVVLELLEVLGVGVAVVVGTEPELLGAAVVVGGLMADEQAGAGGDTDRFGPCSREVVRASRVQVDDLGGQGVPGGSRLVIVLSDRAGGECGRGGRIAEALKPSAGVDPIDAGDGSAHCAVRTHLGHRERAEPGAPVVAGGGGVRGQEE